MSLQESNSQLHQILLCLSERWGGGRASDIVKAESSRKDPRATGGLVSNLPHLRVNKTKQHLLESLKTCLAAKFVGSWHCAASFSLQVPKSCTDLDPTLLYILILRTYTKFVRKNKILALGVCLLGRNPARACIKRQENRKIAAS